MAHLLMQAKQPLRDGEEESRKSAKESRKSEKESRHGAPHQSCYAKWS